MTQPVTEIPAPASVPGPPPKPRAGGSPVIPIFLIGAGAYLMWFGVKYWRGAGPSTWPSYPVKSILQGKGLPPNTPAPSPEAELAGIEQPTPSGTISGYANPFTGVKGLTPERIDQGVDFAGTGQVTAIGPGVVTYAGQGSQTGWDASHGGVDPGGYVSYKLTGGPAAGHEVYVAEGITPSVAVGQKIGAGEVIAQMTGAIETGWAANPPGTLSQTQAAGGIGGRGPFPTKVGVNFDRLLIALGVPASGNLTAPQSGDLPPGYPDTWSVGEVKGRPQNTAKMLLSLFGWDAGQFPALDTLWTRESGWRTSARNPSTGAYGIAQACSTCGPNPTPGPAGSESNEYTADYGLTEAQARAANSGNMLWQIRWGLGYIKARYGSPGAALAHEQAQGWY